MPVIAHDPLRQAAYLKQCLSENKRPIGFLLAAGCPQAVRVDSKPLIPAIEALTTQVNEKLAKEKCSANFAKVLANLATDGNAEPNLEVVLTHIRGLTEVAGKGEVRGLKANELKELDTAICAEIVAAVSKSLPSTLNAYHRFAAWVKARERKEAVEVFTPNYDLLFEQAFEESGVPYFDGFVGSRRAFFDTQAMEGDKLPPRWARLWKLHGSINWRKGDDGKAFRGVADEGVSRYMIHPSHLKYDESGRMPFLAMIDRLRHFLRQPSAVLVCGGYSFGDKHLNAAIEEALQGNPHATLFALCYGPLRNYPAAQKLAERSGNFSLFADDQAIVGTRQGDWSPAETSTTVAVSPVIDENGKPTSAKFALGDFDAFGKFLAELMGEIPVHSPDHAD